MLSELYVDLLPFINSRAVDLLDNDRLAAQLVGLERRTARGGRDSIDNAPGRHDDLANAVAGALVAASKKSAQPSWGAHAHNMQRFANVGHADKKRHRLASEPQHSGGELVRSITSSPRDVVSREFELDRIDRLNSGASRQTQAHRGGVDDDKPLTAILR
jgi:hypothetical protein